MWWYFALLGYLIGQADNEPEPQTESVPAPAAAPQPAPEELAPAEWPERVFGWAVWALAAVALYWVLTHGLPVSLAPLMDYR